MSNDRLYWCKECREEVTGYSRIKREDDPKGRLDSRRKVKRIDIPLCRKGHVMQPIAETSKECPVCHTVGLPDYHTKAGSLDPNGRKYGAWRVRYENKPCGHCERELKDLREFAADQKMRLEGSVEYVLNRFLYIQHGRAHIYDIHDKLRAKLTAVATGLAASHRKSDNGHYDAVNEGRVIFRNEGTGSNAFDSDLVILRPTQAKALDELYAVLHEFGDAVYSEGYDTGRNVLTALMNDEITTHVFEKDR